MQKLVIGHRSLVINRQGFSLLEVMVVVAIIAIMATTVSIGFSSFGNTVRVQESAGIIKDTINQLKLETIRKDYMKNTIQFDTNYLIVESEVEGANLDLEWTGDCLNIDNTGASNPVLLAQRDQYGNNLNLYTYDIDETECKNVDFETSEEKEWQYQLFYENSYSNIIRFIHFNVNRNALRDLVIIEDNDYSLSIEAPYAKETFYASGTIETGPVTLTVRDEDEENSETLNFQE